MNKMNNINKYVVYLDRFTEIVGKDSIKCDEPMKNHTSFKVGGPADIFIVPKKTSELVETIKACKANKIPFYIIGNGTNLVVRDKGIRGIVIKTGGKYKNYLVNDNIIQAESGILLSTLSKAAYQCELTGLEFASGIPGTLGGAVAMNAGAYGGEMKDIVIKTCYLDYECELKTIEGEQHLFGHRTSFFQKTGGIILATYLQLTKGKKELIKEKMDMLNKKRADSQPIDMPSAGSVFKRPEGNFTGPLIEKCGLKGYSIGGAQVSNKHCGFIVNKGDALAKDITDLIEYIQNKVETKFGVQLETEIKIIGEE